MVLARRDLSAVFETAEPARDLTTGGPVIARQVSWSPDGKFIYAAVVETDADIVLLDGMLR